MNKQNIPIIVILAALLGGVYYLQSSTSGPSNAPSGSGYTAHSSQKTDKNLVEIFYLPHAPAMTVVKKVEEIMRQHPKYTVKEYSFDDNANQQKVEEYALTEHTPVAIFIGGKNTFSIAGENISFKNFPKSDPFVPSFAGSWDYGDIETVLTNPDQY